MSSFGVHELRKKGPVILFRWRHTELNPLRIHLQVELLNVGHREAQLDTSRIQLLRDVNSCERRALCVPCSQTFTTPRRGFGPAPFGYPSSEHRARHL